MKKIAVIGANAHQTPLISKIQENGYEAHVFAWQMREPGEYLADHFYPISITEYARILEKCEEIKPSAAVTICSDLTAGTVAMLNEELQLTGNTTEIVHRAVDKLRMRNSVAQNKQIDVMQPAYYQADDVMQDSFLQTISYPVVVKPADRSGGRGVRKVENQAELLQAISVAKDFSFSKNALVEDFIEGAHVRVECISFAGKHYALAVTLDEIVYVNDTFIEKSHTQSAAITARYQQLLQEKATAVLQTLGFEYGASSIEFVVTSDDVPYLIEVNASMCGDFVGTHLVPFTTGYDYLQATLDLALGKALPVPVVQVGKTAKVCFILSASDYASLEKMRKEAPEKIVLDSQFKNVSILPEKDSKYRYGYYVSVED